MWGGGKSTYTRSQHSRMRGAIISSWFSWPSLLLPMAEMLLSYSPDANENPANLVLRPSASRLENVMFPSQTVASDITFELMLALRRRFRPGPVLAEASNDEMSVCLSLSGRMR
ncbi:unnamed protein product [Schistocephalus solidus]|uniref:Secreted protein n=1 Tax=Schistocephalus solidus TaxID=70667 RepID=A0A183T476_SCHSO|nr:unnamed protein product [Schistocephalus solidus]